MYLLKFSLVFCPRLATHHARPSVNLVRITFIEKKSSWFLSCTLENAVNWQ